MKKYNASAQFVLDFTDSMKINIQLSVFKQSWLFLQLEMTVHDKVCGYLDLVVCFVKKCLPLPKTLQLHHLWLLVWKFTKFFMTSLKPQVIFPSIFASLFSVMTLTQLYLFSSNSSPSTYKFSEFLMLVWKFTKFVMPFFKPEVIFSSKLASLFSVMRRNSSVHF